MEEKTTSSDGLGMFFDTPEIRQIKFYSMTFVLEAAQLHHPKVCSLGNRIHVSVRPEIIVHPK